MTFFSLKLVGIVSFGIVFDTSIILPHVITESPIILPKYLTFWQVQILGFQIYVFSHLWYFLRSLHSHKYLLLFQFWFQWHFLPSYYMHMMYVLLMFLTFLTYLKHLNLHILFGTHSIGKIIKSITTFITSV